MKLSKRGMIRIRTPAIRDMIGDMWATVRCIECSLGLSSREEGEKESLRVIFRTTAAHRSEIGDACGGIGVPRLGGCSKIPRMPRRLFWDEGQRTEFGRGGGGGRASGERGEVMRN